MEEIKEYLKNKVEQYEIYYEDYLTEKCELNKGQVDVFTSGNVKGLGIRVYNNKKIGFSTTTDIKNYKKCCDDAISIAKLNEKDEHFVNFAKPGKYKEDKYYSKNIINLEPEDMKKYMEEAIKIIDQNKIKLTSGRFSKSVIKTHIINSESVDVVNTETWNYAYFELLDEKTGVSHFGMEHSSYGLLSYEKLNELIERIKFMSKRYTPKTGDMKLILHPEAVADLLDNFLMYNINAENVQNKRSLFIDKLDKEILSNKLTIIDDGTIEGYKFSSRCDDEGTPRKKVILVENGVLKSYLHNSYTANKDNVDNTGHASRNYANLPGIGTTNVIIEKGEKNFKEILKNVKKGIYVKRVLGLHTMNSLTGDFSVGILEGHIIENGKIKHAVKDTMISGNVLELLKNIEDIDDKIYYAGDGYYAPNILFNNIKVIGK